MDTFQWTAIKIIDNELFIAELTNRLESEFEYQINLDRNFQPANTLFSTRSIEIYKLKNDIDNSICRNGLSPQSLQQFLKLHSLQSTSDSISDSLSDSFCGMQDCDKNCEL